MFSPSDFLHTVFLLVWAIYLPAYYIVLIRPSIDDLAARKRIRAHVLVGYGIQLTCGSAILVDPYESLWLTITLLFGCWHAVVLGVARWKCRVRGTGRADFIPLGLGLLAALATAVALRCSSYIGAPFDYMPNELDEGGWILSAGLGVSIALLFIQGWRHAAQADRATLAQKVLAVVAVLVALACLAALVLYRLL